MAEYTAVAPQTVNVGANVLFTDTVVRPCPAVRRREGSGIITLKGGHTFLVGFSANISGATAGTEVDLALTISGEELGATRMASTPAVAEDLNNVATFTEIEVPPCCCYTVAVENVGTEALTVANANLVIYRKE